MNGDDPFTPPAVPPQQMVQSDQASTLPSGMYYVQEKVFVGLENVQPEFNLREKLVGPGESYFHHIAKETGAKVHLRGRGSGFIEQTSGREAFESLYVYISHINYAGLGAAKKLVENLIQTVHTAYQQFQMQPTSNSYYPNYGGYPGQNTGPPPNRPPHMYNMAPLSGYGPPPHSGRPPPPSYPSYQYPSPNGPPPHYNQPPQPGPNHNIPPGQQMPPHTMYPNPELRHEGPKPLMDQRLPYGDPRPPMQHTTAPCTPDSPTQPHPQPAPSQFNYNTPPVFDHSNSNNEMKSKKTEGKPAEPSKPAKRRFTEAPTKKSTPLAGPESVTIEKQRSVSTLDQQSTQSHTPGDDKRGSNMAPPVLPAPKLKSSDGNIKKESSTSSDGFKMPVMPVSMVLSGAKKNLLGPPSAAPKHAGKKRKLNQTDDEKKSSGFALLGSYDDSSDED